MHELGEPLDSLVLKVERAKKHILELESAYEGFRRDNAYHIAFKNDPNTRQRVYYLSGFKPVPKDFSPIIGDALSNLRSCLDHAVYAMIQVGNPSAIKNSEIFFPVAGSAADYQTRLKRIEPALRQDAIKAINAVAPYVGGAGEYYWHLARLNNIDKHRLLLTIWGSFHGHTMLPSQRQWVADFHSKNPAEFRESFMAVTPRIHLMEIGDELLRVPETEVEDNMQFLIDIAFAEPDICRGNPVIETLHEFRNLIHHLIFEFDRWGLFR